MKNKFFLVALGLSGELYAAGPITNPLVSFPKMGICIASDMNIASIQVEIWDYHVKHRSMDKSLIDVEKVALLDPKTEHKKWKKYIGPRADEEIPGFFYEGRNRFQPGNVLKFCAYDSNNKKITLPQIDSPSTNCVTVYGESAYKEYLKLGLSLNDQNGAYSIYNFQGASNPGFCMYD